MTTIDWIGFVGVSLILIAFVLNVLGKVSNNNLWFIILNLVGAGMACLASVLMNYWPFIILEAVWTLVSFLSLIKYMQRIQKSSNE